MTRTGVQKELYLTQCPIPLERWVLAVVFNWSSYMPKWNGNTSLVVTCRKSPIFSKGIKILVASSNLLGLAYEKNSSWGLPRNAIMTSPHVHMWREEISLEVELTTTSFLPPCGKEILLVIRITPFWGQGSKNQGQAEFPVSPLEEPSLPMESTLGSQQKLGKGSVP